MAKITLKLVRSFSIGFSIFAPSLNGLYFEIHFACFTLSFWNRGKSLFGFDNFWKI